MNFRKYFLYIIIPVLILGILLYFFNKKESFKVKKVSIQKNVDVSKTVSASGFIKSAVESEIAFPVAGKITAVYKKEGDSVKQGDLIAQVYSEDLFYEAESAKKKVDSTRNILDIYVVTYSDRTARAGGKDVYSETVQKYKDDLAASENIYKSALASLKKTYLYAPFAGTLTKMPYDTGEVVSLTNTITISNLNALEFQGDLDQEDYKFVKPDQEAEIVLDSYPNEIFKGKIVSVPYYVNEESSTKTFKLKISIDNKDNRIVKGMTGDVNIIVDKIASTKVLPFDAIFTEDKTNKKFVWTVDSSNVLSKKYIEIGLEGDTLTQVKSDLPDFVIVPDSSSKTIKEGALASF